MAAVDNAAGRYSRCLLKTEAHIATQSDAAKASTRRFRCARQFARRIERAKKRFTPAQRASDELLSAIAAEVEHSASAIALEAAGTPAFSLLYVQAADRARLNDDALLLEGAGFQTAWFSDRPAQEAGQSDTADFVRLWSTEGLQSFSASPPNAALVCAFAGEPVNAVVRLMEATQPDPGQVLYAVDVLSGCPERGRACDLTCDDPHLFIDSAVQGVCLPPASVAMKNNYFKRQPDSLPYDLDYFLDGVERFDMTKVLVRVPGPTLLSDPKWVSRVELIDAVAAKATTMPNAQFLWLPDLTADFQTRSTAPTHLVNNFLEWRQLVEANHPAVADRVFTQMVLEPEGSVWNPPTASEKTAIWHETRSALPAPYPLGWTGTHEAILKIDRPSTPATLFGAVDGDLYLQIYNIYPPCETVGAWTQPEIMTDLSPDLAAGGYCGGAYGTQCTGPCSPSLGESIYAGPGRLAPSAAGRQVAEIIGAYIRNQQKPPFSTSAAWWERMHFMFSYEQRTSSGSPPPALLGTAQANWDCQQYTDFANTFESNILSRYGQGNVTNLNLGVYIPVNAFQRWDGTQPYAPE
jgi:hypothetical protein